MAGIYIDQWLGIAAPTGKPAAIIARLNAEIAKALADPTLRERYAALALEPVGGSAEQYARQMKEDYDRYGALGSMLFDATIEVVASARTRTVLGMSRYGNMRSRSLPVGARPRVIAVPLRRSLGAVTRRNLIWGTAAPADPLLVNVEWRR